jgi:hypothetical protein
MNGPITARIGSRWSIVDGWGWVRESLSWFASRCQAGSQLTSMIIVPSHRPDLSSIFRLLLILILVSGLAPSAQKTSVRAYGRCVRIISHVKISISSGCLSTDADVWDLPSLAPTTTYDDSDDDSSSQARLAASDTKCAIVPRTFYFHLFGSRDSCRHKSARIRKARLFGHARRASPDDELPASPGPCGPRKKVSKADPVVRRDALPSVRNALVPASKSFRFR